MPASPRLLTLGPPQLLDADGRAVPLGGKSLALLIWLSRGPSGPAHRDRLADLLWSDTDETRARQSLRQTLSQIRTRLGSDAVSTNGQLVELGVTLENDAADFEAASKARRVDDAMALYNGHFLDHFALPGALQFEQWADVERRRLLSMWTSVLDSRVQELLDAGAPREARAIAIRLRDADPDRERSWRLLIESALALGDHALGIADAAALAALLEHDAREPEPATERLFQRVQRSALGATRPATQTAEPLEGDLIGREPQFSLLLESWQRVHTQRGAVRLLVEAPAGMGKSRLLRDFARRLSAGGGTVVLQRARPGEQDIPFAYAARIAEALAILPGAMGVAPDASASLVALNPALRESYASAQSESVRGEDLVRVRAWALGELLRCVADERPLALLLDDWQWIDDRSRTLIEGALAHAELHAMLTVVARRNAGGAGLGSLADSDAAIRLPAWNDTEVRAFIESVAAWPAAPPSGPIASRIRTITDGAPLLVLQLLELARACHLLDRVSGEWRVNDATALGTWLAALDLRGERIKVLRPQERRVALLLAVAGGPVRAAALAHALNGGEVLSALRTLEQGGWAVLHDEGATLSHDALQEALLESTDAGDISKARLALGRAEVDVGPQDRTAFQRAARLLLASGDDEDLVPLYSAWRAGRGLGAEAPTTAEAARQLLGEHATPVRVARLRQATSWRARLVESKVPVLAAVVVSLGVVGWYAAQSVIDARPVAVRFVSAPLSVSQDVAMPTPVLEVVNRRGERVTRDGDSLEILLSGTERSWRGTVAVTHAGLARFPEFRAPEGEDTTPVNRITLRATGAGLRADSARLLGSPSLRLTATTVNGRTLSPQENRATVMLGDSLDVRVALKATTPWVAASVNLVAVPTWGVPKSSWISLRPIPTPNRDFIQRVEFRLPPPPVTGQYFLFLVMAAEPEGAWIASRTNWAVGRPQWGDGNDIASWGPSEAAFVRGSHGTTPRMRGRYRQGMTADPPAADVITIDVRKK